jgi:hypothetical protein
MRTNPPRNIYRDAPQARDAASFHQVNVADLIATEVVRRREWWAAGILARLHSPRV